MIDMTRVTTVYGDRIYVATADLANPRRTQLPIYTAQGEKWANTPAAERRENRGKATTLHRDNIAPGGVSALPVHAPLPTPCTLTISDQHGLRIEPYADREAAERALRLLTDQGAEVALTPLTTAQLRVAAQDAERACDWLRAAGLWAAAIAAYPAAAWAGALAAQDRQRMQQRAEAAAASAAANAG
jgi:hypothetical protein